MPLSDNPSDVSKPPWVSPTELLGNNDQTAGGVTILDNPASLETFFASREPNELLGFDTEVAGWSPKTDHPLHTGRVYCCSLAHFDSTLGNHSVRGTPLARRYFIPLWGAYANTLIPVLNAHLKNYRLAVHNGHSFDRHACKRVGLDIGKVHLDPMRAAKLSDSSAQMKAGLKPLMKSCLGYIGEEYGDIASRPRRLKDKVYKTTGHRKVKSGPLAGLESLYCEGTVCQFSTAEGKSGSEHIPIEEFVTLYPQRMARMIDYASLDAKAHLEIGNLVESKINKSAIGPFYTATWNSYLHEIGNIEQRGICVDRNHFDTQAAVARDDLDKLEIELAEWGDVENWASTQQVSAFFYDILGLPVPPIEGTINAARPAEPGKRSTSAASLAWLRLHEAASDHAYYIDKFIEWKKKTRLLNNYLVGVPSFAVNGRLHPVLKPSTETLRISCSLPPLQQIPGNDPYNIRAGFVASPGHKLIVLDFSQLEIYILAHEMIEHLNDYTLYEALKAGDFYSEVARMCWPTEIGHTTGKLDGEYIKYRKLAKVIVLATNYMKTVNGLRYSLLDEENNPCSFERAQELADAYEAALPGVKSYQDFKGSQALTTHGVEALFGTFRSLSKPWTNGAKRKAANCFDYKTEVLTRTGWKNGHEVDTNEVLLTKNSETGKLEWQVAGFKHFPDYRGDVHVWKHRDFSAITTPEHRWLTDVTHKGTNLCRLTEEVTSSGGHIKIHRTGEYTPLTPSRFTADEIRLLGWAVTDCTHVKRKSGYSFMFSQSKPETRKLVRELVLSFGGKEQKRARDFYLGVDVATKYQPYVADRRLSYELLWSLQPWQAKLLLATIQLADGERVCASDLDKAERYQLLATLAGYHATIMKRLPTGKSQHSPKVQSGGVITRKPYYVVRICKNKRTQVIPRQETIEKGDGVWCPYVPNTFVVVRREGHVYISGNTPMQKGAAIVMAAATKRMSEHKGMREIGAGQVLQVHDEAIVEVPERFAEQAFDYAVDCMVNHGVNLHVDLKVAGGIVDNWGAAEK